MREYWRVRVFVRACVSARERDSAHSLPLIHIALCVSLCVLYCCFARCVCIGYTHLCASIPFCYKCDLQNTCKDDVSMTTSTDHATNILSVYIFFNYTHTRASERE